MDNPAMTSRSEEMRLHSERFEYTSEWSAKRSGAKPPANEEERQELRSLYMGSEPCCECGSDYPKADLIIDSEIYCAKCREAERNRTCGRTTETERQA